MQVAQTILNQLGGNKFIAMTGAKSFVGDVSALQFKLPSNFATNKINCVRVTLEPSDLYTMEFYYIRGCNVKKIETVGGIYNDQLATVFTATTGLDCSL